MKSGLSRRGFLRAFSGRAAGGGLALATATATTEAAANPSEARSLPLTTAGLPGSSKTFFNPQRVLLWGSTRKEIREALSAGHLKAAIVPTGATEQHNEHLSLIADTAQATLIAQQAALNLYPKAIVSTPCPVGYSPYHMARKGTLTLSKETFLAYVFEVVKCLKAHGFKTIFILNGHGGNHRPLRDSIDQWRKELKITLEADSYASAYKDEELSTFLESYRKLRDEEYKTIDQQSALSHASENETSIMLAAYPHLVRPVTMQTYDEAALEYESNLSQDVLEYLEPFTKEGWPKGKNPENARDRARQEQSLLATREKGARLIDIATRSLTERLEKMIQATEQGLPWPPKD